MCAGSEREPLGRDSLVTARPVATRIEKMFRCDYPRSFANCLWLRRFPAPDPLPVAPALTVAFLLACWRRPVSLLRLPAAPTPRRCATLRAAITAAAPGADEIAARSPSADSAGHAAVAPAGAAGRLAGQVGW
jgi:hypothetical protein